MSVCALLVQWFTQTCKFCDPELVKMAFVECMCMPVRIAVEKLVY